MMQSIDSAWLTLILNHLCLPTIKQSRADSAAHADEENWSTTRFPATLAEHEAAGCIREDWLPTVITLDRRCRLRICGLHKLAHHALAIRQHLLALSRIERSHHRHHRF